MSTHYINSITINKKLLVFIAIINISSGMNIVKSIAYNLSLDFNFLEH